MASRFAKNSEILWRDRKRYFGLPISFTRYALVRNEDWTKIYINTGLLFTHEDEINLYRIYDIAVTRTLGDKIFGVGSISLYSKDESTPFIVLSRIKNPYAIRNMIAELVEVEKAKKGFRVAEFN